MNPGKGSLSRFLIVASTTMLLGTFLLLLLPARAGWSGSFLPLVARDWQPAPDVYSPILISEVLFDPVGEEPDFEWVEIYNRGPALISLTTYKLGDAEIRNDQEGMYHFPPKVFIVPGQVLVIANRGDSFTASYGFHPDFEFIDTVPSIPNMVKYKAWSNGSINLSSAGDDVLLLDPDDRFLDAVSWGSSTFAFEPSIESVSEGESIERRPADQDFDGASDWDIQPFPDPGQVNLVPDTPIPTKTSTSTPEPCTPPTVLVSEVYYDPPGDLDPEGEWMELINVGSGPVNLGCLKIGDEESPGGGEGMAAFPPGEAIDPGEVVLVALEADTFFSAYGFEPDFEAINSKPSVPDLIKYDLWASGTINLSNAGDDVLILDEKDNVVDAVSWGNSTYAFDPSVDPIAEGHSIERKPADQDTDEAIDWIDQPFPDPGGVDLEPSPATATPTWTPTWPRTPTPTQTFAPTQTRTPTRTPTKTITPTPTAGDYFGLVINEIHADPDPSLGDANADGAVGSSADEFVEIVNDTNGPIDLSSWTLSDAVGVRHVFPVDSIVPPGCAVLVFGGGIPSGGFGSSLVQISSSGTLSLNDFGDILSIFDSTGNFVVSLTYGTEAGDNQSITRYPDITGGEPLTRHSTADGVDGSLFSPGTRISGDPFAGCLP